MNTHTITLTDDELYAVIAGLKVRENRLLQRKRRAERIADKYEGGAVPPPPITNVRTPSRSSVSSETTPPAMIALQLWPTTSSND